MEEKKLENHNNSILRIKTKRKLFFGPEFSKKIKDLKIFIYGLRGVNKYK